METVAYLYPWDVLGDPGIVDRIRSVGADRVALAAHYHAVRAATPNHPRHEIIDAAWSALYLPAVGEGEIPIEEPAWTAPDAFLRARDVLAGAGLSVAAWIAPLHADPRTWRTTARVVDVYGTVHRHAVCASSPHAGVLVERIAASLRAAGAEDVVAEAIGQLGIDHAHQHEKTSGADWELAQKRLLSVCFCHDCAHAHGDRTAELADAVGAGVRADPDAAADALAQCEELVLGLRGRSTGDLYQRLRRQFPALTVHASPDPWATGAGTPAVWMPDADSVVGNAWHRCDPDALAAIRVPSPQARLGAYVTLLSPDLTADRLRRHLAELQGAGVDELHLYHLGLASERRLQVLREVKA
ncbi:hypothetical protein IM660_04965 [Ruania alkalisoli]|uniref:Uncharacterized protein n=1 Tax=Ruania alkalisoli TaxID=2779775 RepID=A0A7M1SVN6_9MICO|nr:hypothetical protein [Ruania alkalisoli]QOR71640.1 hypothetical protein IM660_04965 [Ruania alkalisoli]